MTREEMEKQRKLLKQGRLAKSQYPTLRAEVEHTLRVNAIVGPLLVLGGILVFLAVYNPGTHQVRMPLGKVASHLLSALVVNAVMVGTIFLLSIPGLKKTRRMLGNGPVAAKNIWRDTLGRIANGSMPYPEALALYQFIHANRIPRFTFLQAVALLAGVCGAVWLAGICKGAMPQEPYISAIFYGLGLFTLSGTLYRHIMPRYRRWRMLHALEKQYPGIVA